MYKMTSEEMVLCVRGRTTHFTTLM